MKVIIYAIITSLIILSLFIFFPFPRCVILPFKLIIFTVKISSYPEIE